jgi:hypothetical protein
MPYPEINLHISFITGHVSYSYPHYVYLPAYWKAWAGLLAFSISHRLAPPPVALDEEPEKNYSWPAPGGGCGGMKR